MHLAPFIFTRDHFVIVLNLEEMVTINQLWTRREDGLFPWSSLSIFFFKFGSHSGDIWQNIQGLKF
jgi:hypothetical protein